VYQFCSFAALSLNEGLIGIKWAGISLFHIVFWCHVKGVCSWGHRWLSRSWILSTSCTYFMIPNQTPEDLPSHLQTSFDDTDLTGHDARVFKRAPWHRGKDLHMKYIYEHGICETWYKYSYNTSAIARCWKGYESNRKPEQCVDLCSTNWQVARW